METNEYRDMIYSSTIIYNGILGASDLHLIANLIIMVSVRWLEHHAVDLLYAIIHIFHIHQRYQPHTASLYKLISISMFIVYMWSIIDSIHITDRRKWYAVTSVEFPLIYLHVRFLCLRRQIYSQQSECWNNLNQLNMNVFFSIHFEMLCIMTPT